MFRNHEAETVLANGIRTDHPVPGLPFVDDSSIPIHDPEAIEAIGRVATRPMWGRFDRRGDGHWHAFTTDPRDYRFSWFVAAHPERGKTVLLSAGTMPPAYGGHGGADRLAERRGGYWWDGATWWRPTGTQLEVDGEWEGAPVEVPVPGATTIAPPVPAREPAWRTAWCSTTEPLRLQDFMGRRPTVSAWAEPAHLWLWALRRSGRDDALPLDKCAYDVAAPELLTERLVDGVTAERRVGVAKGTFSSDGPEPQAVLPDRWSEPVVEGWRRYVARYQPGLLRA